MSPCKHQPQRISVTTLRSLSVARLSSTNTRLYCSISIGNLFVLLLLLPAGSCQLNRHVLISDSQPQTGIVATALFRLYAPTGLLPFDVAKQSQVLAAVPRFPSVAATLLSYCQCDATNSSPGFVDLAFKLGISNTSTFGLSSLVALNPDAPLSAITQQAIRVWNQGVQATVPNLTIATLSEEDVATESNYQPSNALRAVSSMTVEIQAPLPSATMSTPPTTQLQLLHSTVADILSAMRAQLVMGTGTLRVSPVSDIRLATPLPSLITPLNGSTDMVGLRMTTECMVQRCEDTLQQSPGPSRGAPVCLQTPQGAAAYLQEALVALLPSLLPRANVTVSAVPSLGVCTTCAVEQASHWYETNTTKGLPWYLDILDAPAAFTTQPSSGGGSGGSGGATAQDGASSSSSSSSSSSLLDGQWSSDALGTGVNVFLVSSGVHAAHKEFYTMTTNGTVVPESRVQGLYGLDGTDPLKDCSDGKSYIGIGTFAASLIAGRTTGVARNATIQSVRYKLACTSDDTRIWGRGGLSNALDSVIAKLRETQGRTPGVVVIDGWWTPDRLSKDDDQEIQSELSKRLDQLYSLGVVVVTAAASGQLACENIFGLHNSSLTVGSIDPMAVRSFLTTDAYDCVDVWAPGGSLGSTIRGAFADESNSSYRSVVPREGGASWLVAGIIAQYLSLYPQSTPEQVKSYLTSQAASGQLWDVGDGGLQVRTTLRALPLVNMQGSKGQGMSTGAIVGLSVGVACAGLLMVACLTGVGVTIRKRVLAQQRRHSWDSALSSDKLRKLYGLTEYSGSLGSDAKLRTLMESQWMIDADSITICKDSNDGDHVLGEGSFGVVLKAVKDGVQPVAVKVFKAGIHQWGSSPGEMLLREMELLKFVSRDKNVVQFYGCCVKDDRIMLGGDVRNALSNDPDGRLAWAHEGKRLALDIVSGLSFLHANKLIHRDLKSKNVLLTDKGVAKICDVGLAKIHDNGYATQDSMFGTFAWAAPELLLGQKCTEKADIYSMGVVLWEIITQEVPIRGAISMPPPDPIRAPPEVLKVVELCMQPDPKARPTARELYSLLAACPPDPVSLNTTPHLSGVAEHEGEGPPQGVLDHQALYHAVHAAGVWSDDGGGGGQGGGVSMVSGNKGVSDDGALWPGQGMSTDGQGPLMSRDGSSIGPLTPPATHAIYGPCMSMG